jgi:SEFIR domain
MNLDEPPSDKFLISYAHESAEHIAAVRLFCSLLRDHGLDVVVDAFADEERQDWALWTMREVAAAKRVLVVASPRYRARFEATAPVDEGRGVRLEGVLIREEILRDMAAGLRKFVPVLLPGGQIDDIPTMLQPYSATHYPVRALTSDGVQRIVRLLRRDPAADDGVPPQAMQPRDQHTAALRLSVGGGTPAGADAAIRELMTIGVEQVVPEFDEATRSTGAALTGLPEDVVRALAQVGRRLRPMLDRHNAASPASDRLVVSLGAHIAATSDVAMRDATDMADGGAAHRMHALSGAALVVVVSPELHRFIGATRAPYPAARAYREWPLDGDAGRPVLIAVPGRSTCPELPPPDLSARNAPKHEVRIGGNNVGVVGDGNTLTYNGPVHYGSGHLVHADRDAHVTFGGRS